MMVKVPCRRTEAHAPHDACGGLAYGRVDLPERVGGEYMLVSHDDTEGSRGVWTAIIVTCVALGAALGLSVALVALMNR